MCLRHLAKGRPHIGFMGYIDDCSDSRGTIHPHPEGLRSSLPLDPNEIKTESIFKRNLLNRQKKLSEKLFEGSKPSCPEP